MPRARNIKHSFFSNDVLAEIDPLGRLLFIGMWTLADYKGDFEWREKRVKASILPYDNCDIKKLAINLDKSGFIRFYSNGDSVYVRIVNFGKHQNPHKNERDKGTEIPGYDEELRQLIDLKGLTINRDKSGEEPEDYASDPADSLSLIPDSGLLNPETGTMTPEVIAPESATPPPAKKAKAPPVNTKPTWMAYINAYMNRYGIGPLRNAQVNGQMAKFCRSVPLDEAPDIAAFYVCHNDQWYIKQSHPVGPLLKDAQKLRTEMMTGRQVTTTQARQEDMKQSNISAVQSAIAKDKARNGHG